VRDISNKKRLRWSPGLEFHHIRADVKRQLELVRHKAVFRSDFDNFSPPSSCHSRAMEFFQKLPATTEFLSTNTSTKPIAQVSGPPDPPIGFPLHN
jgi:hypothetical protein